MKTHINQPKNVTLAQHFTVTNDWLTPAIRDFVVQHADNGVLDPFAGECHIREALATVGITNFIGWDIDRTLSGVTYNDSLQQICSTGRLIVTNPPYMSRSNVTKRQSEFATYLETNAYDDIYHVAINRCLQAHDFVVAIIPESFLLVAHRYSRLQSMHVIEASMFTKTEWPVLVACFVNYAVPEDEQKIYRNDQFVITVKDLKLFAKIPTRQVSIRFNAKDGNIGFRSVDGRRAEERISFCNREELAYYFDRIRPNARAITMISAPSASGHEKRLIDEANGLVERFRTDCHDLLLYPYICNNSKGIRRRRLDFSAARAILEEAMKNLGLTKSLFGV